MQKHIIDYFSDDENTYTYPGKRDYVKVIIDGRTILKQKKLLLHTVHDLYLKFQNSYTGNEKIPSFSYFASLKPAECIHAGDPGSHTICVCAQHQNIKLRLHAISRKIYYRDLLESAVCDIDNEKCMSHNCEFCPQEIGIQNKFEIIIEELCIDIRNKIDYKNWVDEGSAAALESFTQDIEDFKMDLFTGINDLTFHHYVSENQKQYFSDCKKNLNRDTCVIVMDFSENYSFIIQQSVQAFYYNKKQATLHPFCLYLKDEEGNELLNFNYCVISDTKEHYSYTVNAFTSKLMGIIKDQYNWIKKIIYFSDGAPQQYKNK